MRFHIWPKNDLIPCWYCGHKDARGKSHRRGCPKLPKLKRKALIRLAREVEAGWAAAVEARREKKRAA